MDSEVNSDTYFDDEDGEDAQALDRMVQNSGFLPEDLVNQMHGEELKPPVL